MVNPYFWAKKEEREGEYFWLPLSQHLEDTRLVCGFLWEHWLSQGQKESIVPPESEELGKRIVMFAGAIHDLGKATPCFQKKNNRFAVSDLDIELLEQLERAGFYGISQLKLAFPERSPHNIAGEVLLQQYAGRFFKYQDISSIIGGHHGRPADTDPYEEQINDRRANLFQEERVDSAIAERWKAEQEKIILWALHSCGFYIPEEIPVLTKTAQVQVLGLLTMADWIASNTDYFPLIRWGERSELRSQERLQTAMGRWLKNRMWVPEEVRDIYDLYQRRFGFSPTQVQTALSQVIGQCDEPGLFILEAPMGTGKTEAALAAAEQLACKTKRNGMFFGLPTQATSNGIFPRIRKWLTSIYRDSGEQIELRLVHGKAHLNEEYAKLTQASNIGIDGGEDLGGFAVNQWFSGKRKAIMDDFVVGTVDQFLMLALKQKHLALRHLGLAKKVVIIDEVHAYDAFMSQYLNMAVRWMAAYKVPVILLSATLSGRTRVALTESYLYGLGEKAGKMKIEGKSLEEYLLSEDYPLITWTDGKEVFQKRDFSDHEIKGIEVIRFPEEDILVLVRQLISGGGIVGIIVNTVRKAQKLARLLSEAFGEEMVEVLHSSFLATERVRKEANLLKLAGKEEADRPAAKIVIGTQVIEQSLDIDFDVMLSELAPADLLLQRLGRLHRHKRKRPRPQPHRQPRLYLMGCSDTFDFDEGSAAVYGGYLLARTQQCMKEAIELPTDISPLVQEVYGEGRLSLNAQQQEKYDAFQEEYELYIREKESKAKNYRIDPPGHLGKRKDRKTDSLHKWLTNPQKAEGEALGYAQVRDSAETIEVIALREKGEGYCLLFGEEELSGKIGEAESERKIAASTLKLPERLCYSYNIEATIRELETIYLKKLSSWDQSPWLKGSLAILFDENYDCTVNGLPLHYSREFGLMTGKEEA